MYRIAICLIFTLLFLTRVHSETVVISQDYGGSVEAYTNRWKLYSHRRTRVVIDGTCASACARYMTLANVCATPRGWFYFHGMTTGNGRLLLAESVADSRRWETKAAVDLERKYNAFAFATVRTPPRQRSIRQEEGVYVVYLPPLDHSGRFHKFLKVRATKLVPPCTSLRR